MLCANGCGRDAGEWANRRRARRFCSDACSQEAMKAYQREYKRTHKEALGSRDAERYQREKALRLERQKEYYEQNRERVLEYHAEHWQWEKGSPEHIAKRLDANQRKRARRRSAHQEPVDRQKVWERDEGVCGICGEPADRKDWHLDHIVPLGPGEHSYENVRVTHPKCNIAKGSDDKLVLSEWREAA